ncbi:MAG TPA: hypothetical protein PLZ51_09605, partial [Aggregatilineales bacterium]|nr:hypothetical protein [Aggregatilineales bacterium]
MSAYGAIDNNGTVNATNSTFDSNNAGIYNYFGTTNLTNTTFINNTAYAVNNYNGTVSSTNSTYTTNPCVGSPVVVDLGGNIKNAASTGCPGVILTTLSASATCNGAALDVTITAGDANFDITGDATLLAGG